MIFVTLESSLEKSSFNHLSTSLTQVWTCVNYLLLFVDESNKRVQSFRSEMLCVGVLIVNTEAIEVGEFFLATDRGSEDRAHYQICEVDELHLMLFSENFVEFGILVSEAGLFVAGKEVIKDSLEFLDADFRALDPLSLSSEYCSIM